MSKMGDRFRALDKEEGEEVAEGELVYGLDGTVLTRWLAWRQSREGLVMGETRDVVFVSEVFDDEEEVVAGEATGLAEKVREELVGGLREFFGVEAKGTVLGEGIGVTSVGVENAFF